MRRFAMRAFVLVFVCLACLGVYRADELAAVSGLVTDPHGRSVPGVTILITNINTDVASRTVTNDQGIYRVPSLQPGIYRMTVDKDGFKSIVKSGIELHVQDVASINFELQVGSVNETVTVEAGALVINTTDAAVSTVIDRNFVENMPLNGRSFQDLILLTPGVVTNNPQIASAVGSRGEFSVNGQRTESNYYSVDGVSGNVGASFGDASAAATSGSLPASTALGTTQGLLSVDALEEFRVQTSTYSAEYGRNPGGQFSFATRSGTNQWHGTAFDYIRNDFFDANDWFNDFFGFALPALRQNDFGGTLGGPVEIPRHFNGKDRMFFFFSYEGLRLLQPREASTSYVPTAQLRQSTPSALQPVLNAFPVSNCTPSISNCISDLGNGLGDFIDTWSDPSQIDAYSVRLDYAVRQRLKLFFRFGDTASSSVQRFGGNFSNPSNPSFSSFKTRTYTFGATSLLSSNLSNEFRLNYTSNYAANGFSFSSFGGAQPANFWQLQGVGGFHADISFNLFLGNFGAISDQRSYRGQQNQWNIVDTASISHGRHQVKFGVDFRRLAPLDHYASPQIGYDYFAESSVQSNSADFGFAQSTAPAYPVYLNFSAFAEDEAKLTPRLTLSMGMRWEVNPAPGAADGNLPYTVEGSLTTLTLAPRGTPLWKTGWYNFAPRLGVAYVLNNNPRYETVVRGGGGVFFDTGQQVGSWGYFGPGFVAQSTSFLGGPFPAPVADVNPTVLNPPVAPYSVVYAYPRHLQLPYTLQWNTSVEQVLGESQALTVSYVGASGRRLLKVNEVAGVANFNPNFGDVFFLQTGLTSSYNALQVQFQRHLSGGLQALASYTWSHALDFGSYNSLLSYVRGNSDFDVRHNFSAAVSYDPPSHLQNHFARAVLSHWGFDDRFAARTAFPVTLTGPQAIDPATGKRVNVGLDQVPGAPLYVYGPQYPGGRAINVNAFSLPPGCDPSNCPALTAGNAPRNFVRGFGAWQMDLAVRREFPIFERLKLQFRAEAFNVLNHPNFGSINANYCSPGPGCTFGQATQTLAQSLGTLSPLYQIGGPRSMQFALKLVF